MSTPRVVEPNKGRLSSRSQISEPKIPVVTFNIIKMTWASVGLANCLKSNVPVKYLKNEKILS
jgi:hypothetical protein